MPTTSMIIGYIASGLVLTTFWTNDLRRLRMFAILSNIAFISYGALVWLPPVLGLHLLLLPINAVRLMRMSKTAPVTGHWKLSPPRMAMLMDRVWAVSRSRRFPLRNERIGGAMLAGPLGGSRDSARSL